MNRDSDANAAERPIFIPPRKRGSKSSLHSNSSNQLCASPVFAPGKTNLHNLPISEGNAPNYHHPNVSPPKRSPHNPGIKGKNCTFRSVEIVIDDPVCETPRILTTKTSLTSDTLFTEVDLTTERSALNTASAVRNAKRQMHDKYVTLTGTIKRGRKKGQTMDMKVNISREELDELEQSIAGLAHKKKSADDNGDDCFFKAQQGPHLFLLTVVFFPFVFFISAAYSFYMGTMTWYNILVLFSEKRPICQKIFVSPLLIICYPFFILVMTLGLGFYAAAVQLSWSWENWKREVMDWEKGFYGWICCALNLEDCSPYEVVILAEIQQEAEKPKPNLLKDTSI